jgi:hypothetical protein
VLANVGGEHLDDLGVIVGGVASDALQGVDATEPDIELGTSELVDGPGEALGDLAGPVEPIGEARQDGADRGNAAGQNGQGGGAYGPPIVCPSLGGVETVLEVLVARTAACQIGETVVGEPVRRELERYIADHRQSSETRQRDGHRAKPPKPRQRAKPGPHSPTHRWTIPRCRQSRPAVPRA